MNDSTPHQLRFPSSAGFTVRADFEGGAVSSDFGALLLQGVERQTGLIARLASAIEDKRHPSYIDHSLTDLLRQRIFQTACGYADGNDANSLRHDPMFKLAAARAPLNADNALASGPTFSRLENSVSRKDIYRLAQAFVDAFISSYVTAPSFMAAPASCPNACRASGWDFLKGARLVLMSLIRPTWSNVLMIFLLYADA